MTALTLAAPARAQVASTAVTAGSFLINVPDGWAEKAIIEKVPLLPLYSKEDWQAFQANKENILKPGYNNRPQHWALRFPSARPAGVAFNAKEAGDSPTAPQILIHKADEWAVVGTDGVHEEKPAAEVLKQLRQELKEPTPRPPAFVDGALTFTCLKKPLKFRGGEGIRMITQWTFEPTLATLGELHYLFLGLSDDSTCQIIATFPVGLPGLPKADPKAEHLGRSMARYEGLEKHFADYTADVKKWLEAHAAEMNPSLEVLDEVMQSLVARTWQ